MSSDRDGGVGRHPRRVWVVPENDAEAIEIRKLAEHRETVLATRQRWGATWAALEPDVKAEVERTPAAGATVYGIELGGPNPYGAANIDHHRYGDEDRSHRLSSLAQVAEILGAPLDRWRMLVALNDRGYIPAMMAGRGRRGRRSRP